MLERTPQDVAARLGIALSLALTIVGAPASIRAQAIPAADQFDRAADQAEKKDRPPKAPEVDDVPPPARPRGLRMSRAVICESIDGYENYKVLRSAAQTSEEKLLIYYRPVRYSIKLEDGFYRAHLSQDNEIRKRGRKEIVRQKKKVVEFAPKNKDPLGPIYIRNTISLKGLEPGEYDLTIILHDELDPDAPPTRQVVKFKVIPPHDGAASDAPASRKDDPAPGR